MYDVTKDGKTFEQLEAEINALTFRDAWQVIMSRVYPDNQVLDDSWDELENELLYDRLRPFQSVDGQRIFTTKLPWQDIVDDLAAYKAAELLGLADEFDYLQREKDYSDRFNVLLYWRLAANELSLFPSYNNAAVLLKKIINDDLGDELDSLETKNTELTLEFEFQSRVDIIQQGQGVGNRVVATIAQLNNDNNVTPTQVQAIYGNTDVQAIIVLLQTGALVSAKVMIEALDLTGLEPLDEVGRTRIVSMIDEALGL